MSGKNHRENRKPAFADWIVHPVDPGTGPPGTIVAAVFTRDEHGGYTFTDERGTCADFPPGTVLSVMRKEPVFSPLAAEEEIAAIRERPGEKAGK